MPFFFFCPEPLGIFFISLKYRVYELLKFIHFVLQTLPKTNEKLSCLLLQCLLFLRFLATGERFQYMHYNLRVGATMVGKIVTDTCIAIWDVLSPMHMMGNPTVEKWNQIAERFEELWNFSNCCGAIDGKHVRIEAPWNSGSLFYNYKSYHSIVLQAVVDAEGKFLIVDVGEAGKTSDEGVFLSSTFGRMFNDQSLNLPMPRQLYTDKNIKFPYVFVGDDAYALYKHMMKPFAKNSLTRQRRIYNYRTGPST